MSEPTPTPWIDRDDEDCTHPAFLDRHYGECRIMSSADYLLALRCVNVHGALVAALAESTELLASFCEGERDDPATGITGWGNCHEAIRRGRDLVARAKGETP